MDVLSIIKAEHDQILKQLVELQNGKTLTQRRTAYAGLEEGLVVHMYLLETYVYPEMQGLSQASDVALSVCRASHSGIFKAAKALGTYLGKPVAEQTATELDERLGELTDQIQRHVGSEEDVLMPRLRQLIPTQAREDIGQVVLDARDDAKELHATKGMVLLTAAVPAKTARKKRA